MEKCWLCDSKKTHSARAVSSWPQIRSIFKNTFWILAFTLVGTLPAQAVQWKWAGFEIIGFKKANREEVRKLIPIKIGSAFKNDTKNWGIWCAKIIQKFKLHKALCSAVRYSSGKSYFVVDAIEKGDEDRLGFRSQPDDDVKLASPEVNKTYDLLYARLWKLFNQGKPPKENVDKGFLSYSDPKMKKMAEILSKKVPKHKESLFDVLEDDKSAEKRGKAANLLNWANLSEKEVLKASELLDDPSSLVRNNLSRYILSAVGRVKDEDVQEDLVENLCKQLMRPSHGDRNKAIYALFYLAKNYKNSRKIIKQECLKQIQFIARQSILENVQGPARDLLKMI